MWTHCTRFSHQINQIENEMLFLCTNDFARTDNGSLIYSLQGRGTSFCGTEGPTYVRDITVSDHIESLELLAEVLDYSRRMDRKTSCVCK